MGFGSAGGGIFTKPETEEDGVGLADIGGEPSTQAEGCAFSTNEKKFHGTFDEEFIEGTAKLLTHEGYNLAGAVSWFSWVSADRTVRVFSDWRACLRVDSRCVLISIPTRLGSCYLCLASRPGKPPRFGPNVLPSASDPKCSQLVVLPVDRLLADLLLPVET